MKTQEEITIALRKICRQNGLRPNEIAVDPPRPYNTGVPGLRDDTNLTMISFYWDENYFDKLYFEHTKIENLQRAVCSWIIENIPEHTGLEWGQSDGHLFAMMDTPKSE